MRPAIKTTGQKSIREYQPKRLTLGLAGYYDLVIAQIELGGVMRIDGPLRDGFDIAWSTPSFWDKKDAAWP